MKKMYRRKDRVSDQIMESFKRTEERRIKYGLYDSDPIFGETSKLLFKAGDKLQYMIQWESNYLPKTPRDFAHIDTIRKHMIRFVDMAKQMGIKVDVVWEKMAGRHGIKNELPEHLKRPEQQKKSSKVYSNPKFTETNRFLSKASDNLQSIIQGDYVPKTSMDFTHLDAIRHHMYRFVRLAGQMGINLNLELPEKINQQKRIKQHIDDAEIVDE